MMKTKISSAVLAFGLALMAFAGTALADHNDQHNMSSNINGSVSNFVPLIVTLFLVGIALAALTGFWVGKKR